MLSLQLFTCLTVVFAAKSPVADSGSQPKAVRLVVNPDGEVSGPKLAQDFADYSDMERKVQKKPKNFENLNTDMEEPMKPKKAPKRIDATLRTEPHVLPPHETHDSGPHPGPVQKTAVEEPTPHQYDTDPTYCWGDGGVYRWTVVTQFYEGELTPEYEAGLRKNRRAYAKKWNYEYCEFKMTMIGREGWDKLAAASSLLRRRRGKILVLDTDSVIMNMDISLEQIQKKYRNDKDIMFATDIYEPRGKSNFMNSSLTSGAFFIWNGVWAQNFLLDWMLFLQDDDYMANNYKSDQGLFDGPASNARTSESRIGYTSWGWSDEYHGFLDKEQTGLLALRLREPDEWDVHVEVVPWNVFSSPYPVPIDSDNQKWASDPTWKFQPGDFILHPHGRKDVQKTIYQDLFSKADSCALTGKADPPCRWFEKTDNKFALNFPTYMGMTAEEWDVKGATMKANGIKYGIPIFAVFAIASAGLSFYLRKKAASA